MGRCLGHLQRLGGRKLCVGQSWINKAKDGRLGAQEVSVLLSPGDDGGDDTQQMCCWDTWQGASPQDRRAELRRSQDSGGMRGSLRRDRTGRERLS